MMMFRSQYGLTQWGGTMQKLEMTKLSERSSPSLTSRCGDETKFENNPYCVNENISKHQVQHHQGCRSDLEHFTKCSERCRLSWPSKNIINFTPLKYHRHHNQNIISLMIDLQNSWHDSYMSSNHYCHDQKARLIDMFLDGGKIWKNVIVVAKQVGCGVVMMTW